jgi:hypothetical protein
MGTISFAQIMVFQGFTPYSVIVCTAWHETQKTTIAVAALLTMAVDTSELSPS